MMDLRRGHSSLFLIIVFVPRHGNSYTRGYKWFEKDFHGLVSHNYPKFLFVQTIPVPREIIPMSLLRIIDASIDRIRIDICIVALERSFCPRSREQSGSFTDDGERMPFLSTSAFTRFYKDKIIFPNWNGCHFPKENKDYSKNAIKLVLFFNFRKVFFFKSSLLYFCSILR